MKYILLTVCLYGILFGQDLLVEKQQRFTIQSDPNLYTSNFSLQMEEFQQNIIEENFHKAVTLVNSYGICKGGKYTIHPHYKNKTYQGYINFTCRFQDTKKYEKLLDKIKALKGKLSQGTIQALNDQNTLDIIEKQLEIKALSFPSTYNQFLVDNLNGFNNCLVQKISFNNTTGQTPMPYLLRSNESSASKVTLPIHEKLKHTLIVNYVFKCQRK